jgi:hypothetical protein
VVKLLDCCTTLSPFYADVVFSAPTDDFITVSSDRPSPSNR